MDFEKGIGEGIVKSCKSGLKDVKRCSDRLCGGHPFLVGGGEEEIGNRMGNRMGRSRNLRIECHMCVMSIFPGRGTCFEINPRG